MKIPHYFAGAITPHHSQIIYSQSVLCLALEELSSQSGADSMAESICLAVEYTYIAGQARVQHATRADPGNHYIVHKSDFT